MVEIEYQMGVEEVGNYADVQIALFESKDRGHENVDPIMEEIDEEDSLEKNLHRLVRNSHKTFIEEQENKKIMMCS